MNNLYDNGYQLLGTIKDIKNYSMETLEIMKKVGDDYVVETCEETLDIIKDLEEKYKEDTIVMINYENGMGFTWELWTKEHIVKVGK